MRFTCISVCYEQYHLPCFSMLQFPLLHCFSNTVCFCHIVRFFSGCAVAQAVICQFHMEAEVRPWAAPHRKCGAQSDIENFSFPSTNNSISTCTLAGMIWYSSLQYQGTESDPTLSSVFFVTHTQEGF